MKRIIKDLGIEDARHLLAAQGWLELGDAASAGDELKEITPEERAHPAVLHMQYLILAKSENWNTAAEVAENLLSLVPEDAGTWINLAYATRRKAGGGIPAAKRILLTAETKFPAECVIPFNLACYCAQLHEFEQAEQWLRKAAVIDQKTVRKMAVEDPDLKPLWDSRGGATIWK